MFGIIISLDRDIPVGVHTINISTNRSRRPVGSFKRIGGRIGCEKIKCRVEDLFRRLLVRSNATRVVRD